MFKTRPSNKESKLDKMKKDILLQKKYSTLTCRIDTNLLKKFMIKARTEDTSMTAKILDWINKYLGEK